MLMTLEAIRDGLKAKHAHPSFDRSNLMLGQPGASADAAQRASATLKVAFPPAFYDLVTRFNFDRLEIHKLSFSYGKELKRFTQTNLGEPYAWWQDDKPENQLWIAQTERHYLLLHTTTGRVHAFHKSRHDDQGLIAADFGLLVRAAGSLELQPHTAALVGKIAKEAGADPGGIFWELLAEGSA
jgi:hypothetical protein